MYVVMGLSTPCVLRNIFGKDLPWFYAAAGAVGGSMVILEAPSRQLGKFLFILFLLRLSRWFAYVELALYCLPRALESLWKTALKNGTVRSVPHGDIMLFMASMGTLMTLYQNEKDTINSHYLSVLTRFFGDN